MGAQFAVRLPDLAAEVTGLEGAQAIAQPQREAQLKGLARGGWAGPMGLQSGAIGLETGNPSRPALDADHFRRMHGKEPVEVVREDGPCERIPHLLVDDPLVAGNRVERQGGGQGKQEGQANGFHSVRRASMGLVRAARRAGSQQMSSAAGSRSRPTAPSARGSWAEVS